MTRYTKEFREQAIVLSDEIGVKKAAEQLMKEIAELMEANEILDEHPENHNYGIDRILLALNQRGEYPSRSTVIRAMKKGTLLPDGKFFVTLKDDLKRFVEHYGHTNLYFQKRQCKELCELQL